MSKCVSVFVFIFILKRMNNPLQTPCRYFQVFRDVQSNTFADLLLHVIILAGPRPKAQGPRPKRIDAALKPIFFFLPEDENGFSLWIYIYIYIYTFFLLSISSADILQTHLMSTCYTKFLLINYCSDMFQPHCFPIFRELIRFCKLYINLLCRFFTYTIKIIIEIE